jgi:F0F1-type ATP synthase membrane subunit b/b'
MNLTPDPVLVVLQLFPLLVLMGGLHVILFKPMLAYLHERDRATAGARREAEDLAARAAARLLEYEAALEKARNEVAEFRAGRRAEAQKVHQDVVAAARKEADVRIAAAVTQIQVEAAQARSQLGATAHALAGEVASQVLGRPVTPSMEA